jgi:hypothetical protein
MKKLLRGQFLITVINKPFLPDGNVLIIEEIPDQDVAILLVEIALLFGKAAVVCGVLVLG